MTRASEPTTFLGVDVSAGGKRWQSRPVADRQVLAFSQRFGLPDILGRVLLARGVDLDDVETYLDPKLRDILPDPNQLKDMDVAVTRLTKAIVNQEKICVFGDYDVDGATSTSVLLRYFSQIGIEADFYIPDRMKEGYGPNIPAIKSIKENGADLVITVDCGTMSIEPLSVAKDIGLDVIVVDHHQTGDMSPKALAMINPRRPDDDSGLGHLAAVGVCFMLIVALNRHLRRMGFFSEARPEKAANISATTTAIAEPNLMGFLDIVALGTVCDVVPLQGLNRAFVLQGLKVIEQGTNTGLAALQKVSGVSLPVGTYDLGYLMGPRINAGGRVGQSDLGTRLLTTQDAEEAVGLSMRLHDFNQERREIEAHVQMEAFAQIDAWVAQHNTPPAVLIASADGWHPGVIGIVSGRMKDRYYRPSFVISFDDSGLGKGSGRSIAGYDIGAAIAKAVSQGIIDGGGGHAMAAGVTLRREQLAPFLDYMNDVFAAAGQGNLRHLSVDGALSPLAATRDLYEMLQKAGPFGAANPEPCFVFPNISLGGPSVVGDQHVRCTLKEPAGGSLKAMAFNSTDEGVRSLLLTHRGPIHVAGYLRADDWRGRRSVQLIIQDAARA